MNMWFGGHMDDFEREAYNRERYPAWDMDGEDIGPEDYYEFPLEDHDDAHYEDLDANRPPEDFFFNEDNDVAHILAELAKRLDGLAKEVDMLKRMVGIGPI